MKKVKYILAHSKLAIHLLFRTKKIGVNNQLIQAQSSLFGLSIIGQIKNFLLIYPLYVNYQHMKWRMSPSIGFVPEDEYRLVFDEK